MKKQPPHRTNPITSRIIEKIIACNPNFDNHKAEHFLQQELKLVNNELNRRKIPKDMLQRCNIVLEVINNNANLLFVAKKLNCDIKTVNKWWNRFMLNGFTALKDKARSGRPSKAIFELRSLVETLVIFTPDFISQSKYLTKFADKLSGQKKWTLQLLADICGVSIGSMHNYINKWNIKLNSPCESYCFSKDPYFIKKALLIDLCYNFAELNGYMLHCFDEAPCLQAIYKDYVLNMAGDLKASDRYSRKGCTNLLLFLHPKTGCIEGYCKSNKNANTLIKVFDSYIQKQGVNKKHIFIVDNLNVHGIVQQAIEKKYPNVKFVYIPTNASWMNLAESAISIVKRGLPANPSYENVEQLESSIQAVIDKHNKNVTPYKWNYNIKRHLNQLLNTIANIRQNCSIDLKNISLDQDNGVSLTLQSTIKTMTDIAYNGSFSEESLKEVKSLINYGAILDYFNNQNGDNIPLTEQESSEFDNKELKQNTFDKEILNQEVLDALSNQEKANILLEKLLQEQQKPYRSPSQIKISKDSVVSAKNKYKADKQNVEDTQQQIQTLLKEENHMLKDLYKQLSIYKRNLTKSLKRYIHLLKLYRQHISLNRRIHKQQNEQLLKRVDDAVQVFTRATNKYNHKDIALTEVK